MMLENSTPVKVTVLMAVYNAGNYLVEAIESILNQTYKNIEFLILNDGSTDHSAEIIESFNDRRIKFVNNEKNQGLAATLNEGLQLSRGEYIARMDQDDISLPNRLEVQVKYLDEHPEVGVVGCRARMVGPNLEFISESERAVTDNQNKWRLLFGTTILHPAVMFRRDVILSHGGYSKENPHCEEYDLWSRLYDSVIMHQIPDTLVHLRKHESNSGVVFKDISTKNILKISIQNILRLNSEKLNYHDVKEAVEWIRGFRTENSHLYNISKTLFILFFCFFHVHSVSKKDYLWISDNFISMLSPALFKLSFVSQLSILFWSINFSKNNIYQHSILYFFLFRKYITSLIS